MTKRKVKIVWESIRGTKHSKQVAENNVAAEIDRLRSLPDVKSKSVRVSL